MFRLFNKNAKVYVLNGGLPRWEAEKRPLESGESKPVEKRWCRCRNFTCYDMYFKIFTSTPKYDGRKIDRIKPCLCGKIGSLHGKFLI